MSEISNTGVLYVRYDKDSSCGQLIERLKSQHNYKMSQKVLQILFLSEIIEGINPNEIEEVEEYSEFCYDSLRFFNRKIALVNQQIQGLAHRSISSDFNKVAS